MSAPFDGGCLCGGVRYRLHRPPTRVCDCHCIDCRRASAAPFVTWGTVSKEDLEILRGELRRVEFAGRLRSFASCCGTPLFFRDDDNSQSIDVTVASLDHPELYPPAVDIWTDDQLPWTVLDTSRPTFRQGRKIQ